MGACIDNEVTAVKRKEFIEFEKQRTGCIEHTCDNDIGLITWSLCNSTESQNLVCMNDRCIEDKSVMDEKVKIEIEIEEGLKAIEMNTSDFVESLSLQLGIEKELISMAYECDNEGNIVRIILYVNNEQDVNAIVEGVKKLNTIRIKQIWVALNTFSGSNKHPDGMILMILFGVLGIFFLI